MSDDEDKQVKLPPPTPPPPKASIPPPPATSSLRPPPPVPPPPAPNRTFGAPVPTPEGFMSADAKMSLADIALALRDEQLEAKVVHYKADLETNAELDAVTAQVIADLQNLQAEARRGLPSMAPGPDVDRTQLEAELVHSLTTMLARIFRPNRLATHVERKLSEVAKRFARLFFESELAERIHGRSEDMPAMRFADQAMYHALRRAEEAIFGHLDSFQYTDPHVRTRAEQAYLAMVKSLRNDFLARTTPELNVLVGYLNEVLTNFFTQELPPQLADIARQVVTEAALADAKTRAGYKISASSFPKFRQVFERHFLKQLVPYTEEEMLNRVRETSGQFRNETIQFVATPAIFSELCDVICDSVYDMLYNDGFLDLPTDWHARLSSR